LSLDPFAALSFDPVVKDRLGSCVTFNSQLTVIELEIAHGLHARKHRLKAIELGDSKGLRSTGVRAGSLPRDQGSTGLKKALNERV